MESKDIKRNSFWGKWCSLTRANDPSTTCELSWHMIFSLITFPLWVFPGLLINGIFKLIGNIQVFEWYVYILLNFMFFILGCGYYSSIDNKFDDVSLFQFYWHGICVFVIVSIGAVLFPFLCVGIVEGSKWIWGKITGQFHSENTLTDLYHSVKDKHCSKINWK